MIDSGVYKTIIILALEEHQDWEVNHTEKGSRLFEDLTISEVYGLFRSFKRGAITRAQEAGVSESDVNFMGRWRSVELAAGRKPGRLMREHYTEVSQLFCSRLRLSKAL